MKIFLGLILIVVLIVIYFLIDQYIATQMWVYTGGEEWHIVAEGWSMLLHAWVVALGGALIGFVIGFFIYGGWLWLWAEKEDQQARIEKAQTRADTAETRAQADVAKERAAIKYREAEVKSRSDLLDREKAQFEYVIEVRAKELCHKILIGKNRQIARKKQRIENLELALKKSPHKLSEKLNRDLNPLNA